MGEKLQSHEQHHQPEQHASSQERKHLEELHEKGRKAEHEPKDAIESIKKSIEQTAISGKEYASKGQEHKNHHQYGITKQLKADTYKRTLRKAQAHLSRSERSFSKIIHRPVIERTSDIAAKTVARPSGILFGGICAFLGTLFVLLISKRSGFSYNYLLFALMFISGYVIGLILELIFRVLRKSSRP